jgi:sulfur-oxidizing protein SoxY
MLQRRDALAHAAKLAALLVGAGWLPRDAIALAHTAGYNSAAFEIKTVPQLFKSFWSGTPAESKDVTLTAPDIAENGAVVPLTIASSLPGVKGMLLLIERNPNVLAAMFDVTEFIDANFSTRVKMNQSSNVYAVAVMADGKLLFAQKDVKVTLGGCGA